MLESFDSPCATTDPVFTAPSDIFSKISPNEFSDLLSIGTIRNYEKGEFIYRAGDPGVNVYFLRSGRVKIYQNSTLGREVILWFCFPGEIFGLTEVVHSAGRAVNAQTCERAEVLCIARSQFRDYLETHSGASFVIMQALACRMRVLGDMLVNLIDDDVNSRIVKLMLRLSACHGTRVGNEVHLNIRMTHQEIADMVGTARQTVTKVLSELKLRGLLSIENHRIRIRSQELLNEHSRSS